MSQINIRRLFSILILFLFYNATAQKHDQVWDALLNNNRSEALKLSKKLDLDNIESLILKEIVENENGMLQNDFSFLEVLPNYENFEYYLFTNVTMPFVFGDFYESGFSPVLAKKIKEFDINSIENTTAKSNILYVKSEAAKYLRDWDTYEDNINKIPSLKQWEFCGVFENLNSSGIDMPYEPENETSSEVKFNTRSNGDAWWYKNQLKGAYTSFVNHNEYYGGVHYAQTFINSPVEQSVILKLGKNGLIRVWLNDVLVIEDDESYPTELDAISYKVNLQKGINRILVKTTSNFGEAYFMLRLEDINHQPLSNYSISLDNKNYKASTKAFVDPKPVKNSIESFFEKNLKDANKDKNLQTYNLALSYIKNGKIDKALELINAWCEKYPESSFINTLLISCYTLKGDDTSVERLKNKMKNNDADYYLSLMFEFRNTQSLMKEDMDIFEDKLNKIGEKINYTFMKKLTDLIIELRKEDKVAIREKLDLVMEDKNLPTKLRSNFIDFYANFFGDDQKTISMLEEQNKNVLDFNTLNKLANYYNKQNQEEKTLQLYEELHQKQKHDNDYTYDIVNLLHKNNQLERSLPYIEQSLENFPSSYVFKKFKGDVLVQTDNKKEAIKIYKDALSRKPSNSDLRSKINDLENNKNPLYNFYEENQYDYIEANRGKIKENNYGLNVLLEDVNVLNYETGGGHFMETLIYEITSQNGIDIFKEYDLGLSGNYTINKSEAVKINGDIISADRSGSKLVFDNLEIGDVIYIDYDEIYTKTGRFYKDYILNYTFNSYHPTLKTSYRLIAQDKEVHYKVTVGNVKYKTYNKYGYYIHEWINENIPAIQIAESYMPSFEDVTTTLHISSIESWNEIAKWYSDMVRIQFKDEPEVEATFKQLFPDGYKQLTETERAKVLYDYITGEFNYSFVNFRQSGYVPQKPSKTIRTKLGDCKDFSTLFTVLAKKAELETDIVLILTSDYARNELVLPSTDFNHAIVRVNLDGKPQYLELTGKYLPFKSLPISLRGAKALIIPYQYNDATKSDLISLDDVDRKQARFISKAVIEVENETSKINLSSSTSAHIADYFIELLDTKEGDVLKDALQEEINGRSTLPVELKSVQSFEHDQENGEITCVTNLTADIKFNKIGSLLTLKIPHFLLPYNSAIIEEDSRNYPIDYRTYENADYYEEVTIIKLNENQEFIDIPENKKFNFKDHQYSVEYSKAKYNELKIQIIANVNTNTIMPNDYKEFKAYIKNVMDSKDVLVSFKDRD